MRIKAHKMITKKIVFFLLLIGFQLSAQSKKWTLEECVDYAIKNNISIKQSELDLKTSNIDKLEAIGGFLPTLTANANYSVNTGASINPVTNQFQNQKQVFQHLNPQTPMNFFQLKQREYFFHL